MSQRDHLSSPDISFKYTDRQAYHLHLHIKSVAKDSQNQPDIKRLCAASFSPSLKRKAARLECKKKEGVLDVG